VFWLSRIPCAECGEVVDREAADAHRCDRERWLEFQMRVLRGDLLAFDRELEEYLSSPEGRFETWLAAREVWRDA
jgi:hypothetical protein